MNQVSQDSNASDFSEQRQIQLFRRDEDESGDEASQGSDGSDETPTVVGSVNSGDITMELDQEGSTLTNQQIRLLYRERFTIIRFPFSGPTGIETIRRVMNITYDGENFTNEWVEHVYSSPLITFFNRRYNTYLGEDDEDQYHPHHSRFLRFFTGVGPVTEQLEIDLNSNHCRALRVIIFNGQAYVMICGRDKQNGFGRCAHYVCNRPESIIGNPGCYPAFILSQVTKHNGFVIRSEIVRHGIHPMNSFALMSQMLVSFENNLPFYREYGDDTSVFDEDPNEDIESVFEFCEDSDY